jgi:endonuclease YncB( thermonuclease family)
MIALLLKSLLIALLLTPEAYGRESERAYSGVPTITDGDTIRIGKDRFRLYGIDAPERDQVCKLAGKDWSCGRSATSFLRDLVGKQSVRCVQKDRDRYKRIVAVCYQGDVDLNAAMVSAGLAVAYTEFSTDYVAAESEARAQRRGMWAGTFNTPHEHRRKKK